VMSEEMHISTPMSGEDHDLFTELINQGIDSRLEAFTGSRFAYRDNRLEMFFAPCELTTLLRRLLEVGSENADQWAVDIVESEYSVIARE
jgi:hypothetical protein